MPEATRKTI
jgi:ATP-dependent Lon protease